MNKTLSKLISLSLILFSFQYTSSAQCYEEIAQSVGIDAIWGSFGFSGGGGISFADFNNDGFDDLTFTSTSESDINFYENNGDGTFTLLVPPLVSLTEETKTVTWIDIDNDGDKDLFASVFQGPNRMYKNDGDLNFTDVTEEMGLPLDNSTTFGANFGDYDQDGYLDLYITNYGFGMVADTNSMYKNINGEFFEDVTIETGTGNYCDPSFAGALCNTNPGRQSFASTFFDYDLDGDVDLYVTNDRSSFQNALYENNGDGTFTDVASATQSDVNIDGMNAGFGDSNGDGYFDLYVTNTGPSAHLVYDPNQNVYEESAEMIGTIFNRVGWGANFFDYDLDGDEDLYVCSQYPIFGQPNAFYVNDGTGNYTEPFALTGGLGGEDYTLSHCNVIGDIDNDGYQDIAVSGYGSTGTHKLWSSCEANESNYLKFKLVGQLSNADAYGALVEVYTPNDLQRRQKVSQNAYLAQNSDIITVGLGFESIIDSVVISWPFPNSKTVLLNSEITLNSLNIIHEDGTAPPDDDDDDDDDDCWSGSILTAFKKPWRPNEVWFSSLAIRR